MKQLLILMLLAFSFNLSANAVKDVIDSATTVATDVANTVDTSKVSKQIYTDIKAGIAGLATGLKVSTEKVWDILVLQQLVWSITSVIFSIFLAIISNIFLSRGWKLWKKAKEERKEKFGYDDVDFEDGIWCGMICIGIIILLLGIVFTGFNLDNTVTGFINPEYGAIETIVNFVNK